MVFVFLLLTTVVGAWKAHVTGSFNVALAWNGLNTIVLGMFLTVTYREARTARTARRSARQEARRKARRAHRRRTPAPVDISSDPSTTLVGGPR